MGIQRRAQDPSLELLHYTRRLEPVGKADARAVRPTPFCTIQNPGQPYWDPNASLVPQQPTIHQCRLPVRSGYHVILAVWEVADTAMAFYQVVDATFTNGDTTRSPF